MIIRPWPMCPWSLKYVPDETVEKVCDTVRTRIFKRLRSQGIDSKESIAPAYEAWQACTSNRVVVPARQAGNRFLGSLKGLQIRALHPVTARRNRFHEAGNRFLDSLKGLQRRALHPVTARRNIQGTKKQKQSGTHRAGTGCHDMTWHVMKCTHLNRKTWTRACKVRLMFWKPCLCLYREVLANIRRARKAFHFPAFSLQEYRKYVLYTLCITRASIQTQENNTVISDSFGA